jgi:taurine dioxygenase
MANLSLRRLAPFGAEVDLDLGIPFGTDMAAELRAALFEYKLLLFRGHDVSREQQETLAGLFGHIPKSGTDLRFVSNRGGAATLGDQELAFHADMDFAPEPYNAVSLHALRLEDGQTSTKFVDGVALWERMPAKLKVRLEGAKLRNVHVLNYARRDPSVPLDPTMPQHVFTLPRIHPHTGAEYINVSVVGTREVVGMEPQASEALLNELFDYCFRPEHVLEHFWFKKDLIIWDNHALMHARGAVAGPAERTLQKVSALRKTLAEQFPAMAGAWKDVARPFNAAAVQSTISSGPN